MRTTHPRSSPMFKGVSYLELLTGSSLGLTGIRYNAAYRLKYVFASCNYRIASGQDWNHVQCGVRGLRPKSLGKPSIVGVGERREQVRIYWVLISFTRLVIGTWTCQHSILMTYRSCLQMVLTPGFCCPASSFRERSKACSVCLLVCPNVRCMIRRQSFSM